ncbi:MAG: hypothetical protein NZM31_14885 [Gemmatales bacterium]|nr:hypothetical protein [Gemmatales bacterium]MDW8388281.1 hypothetical protein [Gemmatales bacterium]
MRHFVAIVMGFALASTAWGQETSTVKSDLAKADQAAAQPAEKRALPRLATHKELRKLLLQPTEKLGRFSVEPGISVRDACDTLEAVLSTPELVVEIRIAEELFDETRGERLGNVNVPGVTLRAVQARTPDSVLREILKPLKASYLIRKDHILIIPHGYHFSYPNFEPYLMMTVDLDRVPWREAIGQLAEFTGITIILHPQLSEHVKDDLTISGSFTNTSMLTILQVVSTMIGADLVRIGDVIYVAPKPVAQELVETNQASPLY